MKRRRLLQSGAAAAAAGFLLPSVSRAAAMPREQAAAHALNRLGFGPRPGDLEAVARDPRAWVDRQLRPPSLALPPTLTARLQEAQFIQADPTALTRRYTALLRERFQAQNAAGNVKAAANAGDAASSPVGQYVREQQIPAIESRLLRALESPRQLEEAMVDFWFNHFNVFQNKAILRVLVGPYEHQAIRPHAMGRFRDLLGATAHHPAMLYYLDNWQSVGPQGQARGRGLNENYARELMELHTLGVDGGYTQQDVTQLARMLTGWTIAPPRAPGGEALRAGLRVEPAMTPAGFVFNERLHDRGEKTWLGQRIAAQGQSEGERALDHLASHPATAAHISYKLAQYFMGDEPDATLVSRMAQVFLAQDGQIVPVLRTLFESDAFWSADAFGAKFKTPYHYALSTLRAGGYGVPNVVPLAFALGAQGMPLYRCLTPDGYKNTEMAWLNPDAMSKRVNFAAQVAHARLGNETISGGLPAQELMRNLGPLVTPATRELASQPAEDAAFPVALVLAGPGMMRR
jgi:uncharacterized protein (DUF1800 family)